MRRFFLVAVLLHGLLFAQNGSTVVQMPGFFNPLLYRFKNCITTDIAGKVWIGTPQLGVLVWDGSNWSYFDSNNGLTDNSVTSVAADTAGYAWVGTDTGGVCRYDGWGWSYYSSWNSPLPSPHIVCIETESGNAWFGTERGLARFDGSNWWVYTSQNSPLPCDTINDIAAIPGGGVLIATRQGLIHFDGTNWTGYWSHIAGFSVDEAYVYDDGSEWITMVGSLYTNTGSTYTDIGNLYDLPWANMNGNVQSVGKGPTGGIGFCTNRGSLQEIKSGHLQTYYPYGMVVNNVNSTGLFSVSPLNNECWFINDYTPNTNPPTNALMKLDVQQYNGLGLGATGMNTMYLDINSIQARMQNRGDMHWNFSSADYHVPKNSSSCPVFTSSLWVGGLDTSGMVHQAAMLYRQSGEDYFPGPLDPQTGQTDSAQSWKFDRVWKLDQYTISEFQWNFAQGNVQNGTYIVPVDILDWPAIGNNGITEPLAPFTDVNGNGIYDPLTGGDYPVIKGDQEVYCVFNDALAPHTESGGQILGIEVQKHAWAWACTDPSLSDSLSPVNYTTFYTYDIINRSQQTYYKTMIGSWAETDLGNWNDDYAGCNVALNAGFVYNADNYDEDNPPSLGYHNYIPIQSVVVLDGPQAPAGDTIDNDHDGVTDEAGEKMLLSGYYGFSWFTQSYPYSAPTTGPEFYNYLNGRWMDSTSITYGGNGHTGSVPTTLMYPDLPCSGNGWSEFTAGNPIYDRNMLLTTGPVDFHPGDTLHYTVAYITSFDSTNAWNTPAYYQTAFDHIARVSGWYNTMQSPSCMPLFDAVPEQSHQEQNSLMIYPNPAEDAVSIQFHSSSDEARLRIFDSGGRIVYDAAWNGDRLNVPVHDFAPGLYLVQVSDGRNFAAARFIKL